MFSSIRWRIAVPYLVLTIILMLGLTTYITSRVQDGYLQDLEARLLSQAQLISDAVGGPMEDIAGPGEADGLEAPSWQTGAGSLDALARRFSDLVDARVTIIGSDGTVVGESDRDSRGLDNHLMRPEVQQALAEGTGISIRYSETLREDLMYGATRIGTGAETLGVVRVALPLLEVKANVARVRRPFLAATAFAAIMALVLALLLAERTAQPVVRLTQVASRIADGDFSTRLSPTTRDEVGRLTDAFNRMADELQDKVTRLTEERSRLEAILENMADGVVIADSRGEVRLINPAATVLLDTTQTAALGRGFAQVVRHHQIIDLWQNCRADGSSQVGAVEIDRRNIFWQVIITSFRELDTHGYLVIIQDLSRIRRLETVRRDFISNISHELRTPLASLKALTETLRDAALDDPPAAEHFLDRMETEIDALTQMVQELLELSRIESGQVALRLQPTSLEEIIEPPVERLRAQAERAELRLLVTIAPELMEGGSFKVLADVERMQQVVTNLVHNAIKFTPPGGQVSVRASRRHTNELPDMIHKPSSEAAFQGTEQPASPLRAVVEVIDTGAGVPARDLPRIFERFYKADRARGRGGTGLGLSIARHLVESHGGQIWAESTEGQGSRFCLFLPFAGEGAPSASEPTSLAEHEAGAVAT